ncbi:hypothetical protein Aperf_G00000069765 [Anoplocephala perfoliata]
MGTLPKARIVHLYKWPSADGYGFVLKDSQSKEYRIGSVEHNLPAEAAGLMKNDIVIEVNGRSMKNATYTDVVEAIRQYPSRVTLMVLQPFEKNILTRRGVELTSSTCPAHAIHGRRERDDTTDMICRKMAADEVTTTIVNCDLDTAADLSRKRLDLLSTL